MQASCAWRKGPCAGGARRARALRVAGRGEQLGSNGEGEAGGSCRSNGRQKQKSRSRGVLYVCESWAFFMFWKDPFGCSAVNGLRRAREVGGRDAGGCLGGTERRSSHLDCGVEFLRTDQAHGSG